MSCHGGLCNWVNVFKEDYKIQSGNTNLYKNKNQVLMRHFEIPNLCFLTEFVEPSLMKIVSQDSYSPLMSP